MRRERDYERLKGVLKGFGPKKSIAGFAPRFMDTVHELMKVKTMCYDLEDKLDKLTTYIKEKV